MLGVLGAKSLEGLIDETVPKSIRQDAPLDFGKPLSERELMHKMRMTAGKNKVMTSLIGQGYYGTVTPPAIQRNILRTRLGTPPIRLISPRSARAAGGAAELSRPWSAT